MAEKALDYIQVAGTFWHHPKVSALAGKLAVEDRAVWLLLLRFWALTAAHAPRGHHAKQTALLMVAAAMKDAGITGDPQETIQFLADCGFLEQDGEDFVVHGWDEHAGSALRIRANSAERMRKLRERARNNDEHSGACADVQLNVAKRSGTERNGTKTNQGRSAEPDAPRAGVLELKTPPQPRKARPDQSAGPFQAEFEALWPEYPRRYGSNPRNEAGQCYALRRGEGETADLLATCTKNYRIAMERAGKVGTETVMQARRFYGMNKPYLDFATDPGFPAANKPVSQHYSPSNSQIPADAAEWVRGTPEYEARIAREGGKA